MRHLNYIKKYFKTSNIILSVGVVLLVVLLVKKDTEIQELENETATLNKVIKELEVTHVLNDVLIDALNAEVNNLDDKVSENSDIIVELKNNINYFIEKENNKGATKEFYDRNFKKSTEGIAILERITEAEATSGTLEQKMNVARVVLNRVGSEDFPDTIEEVVFQKINGRYQFSPIYDKRYYSVEVTESTKEAVENVLNGEVAHSATFFMVRKYSDSDNVSWFDRNLNFLFNDGVHEFFEG